MKPETDAFLRKSHSFLAMGQELVEAGRWPAEAGRAAYLATFHAAQAMLMELEGRRFKTHLGVHGAFAALVKEDPRFGAEQKKLLGRSYELKNTADYDVGYGNEITTAHAADALAGARGFVATVATVLAEES